MWMDWDNDYYTFSDTNIEYIWRFLKDVHAPRLAVPGPPLDAVVPALRHLAVAARAGRRGELRGARAPVALRALPAERARGRVARDLDDDAVDAAGERRRGGQAGRRVRPSRDGDWVARRAAARTTRTTASCAARSSSASSTRGRSTTCRAGGVVHRVIPWDDVALEEGTGIVHIAPGAGAEDFELSRVHDLPVLVAGQRGAAASTRATAGSRGSRRPRSASRSIDAPARAGLLVEAGTDRAPLPELLALPDAARLPRRRRLVHPRRRDPPADAGGERDGRVDAAQYGKRMDDWLRNMGDWNISRKRYFGLPLPFYPCSLRAPERDRLARRARGAGGQRARPAAGAAPAVDRRGADPLRDVRPEVRRIPEVGDAWLDAGIVPLSTLGWQNADVVSRTATPPARRRA